jgi:endonuclease YncB( thermonuclease family)
MRTATLDVRPQFLEITDLRAIDGDCLDARILLPLGVSVRRRVRIKGFYAPELRGSMPEQAEHARQRLDLAVSCSKCHVQVSGLKEDRYGRLLAVVFINGKPAIAEDVLGPCQLTEEQHKDDLIRSKA